VDPMRYSVKRENEKRFISVKKNQKSFWIFWVGISNFISSANI
jgi:hypothetical protein